MVGILELRDNDFIKSVVAGLSGVPTEFIRAGIQTHPAASPYRLVIDRVSFADPFLRHLMRSWSLAGAYVLNDPFFTLIYDKFSELRLYDALSITYPRTALLPRADPAGDVAELIALPDWALVEAEIGFPCIVKPVDGYAWEDVAVAEDPAALQALYGTLKEKKTLLVQERVVYESYYRAFCMNRSEVFIARWDPQPLDRGVYSLASPAELCSSVCDIMREKTIALNRAEGLDFNAVEWCVRADGTPVVIDSYNDVPDVRPEKLPPSCYDWIVDRFCACVREKLASGERNSLAPSPSGSSDTRALSR